MESKRKISIVQLLVIIGVVIIILGLVIIILAGNKGFSNGGNNELYTLPDKILKDNTAYADNVKSEFVTSSYGINYSEVSSDTNGKGLYYTNNKTSNEKKVYFFRGDVSNNYVIFADKCWRVVRITESGNVKMQYAGVPNDGKCPLNDKKIDSAFSSAYNYTIGDAAYVGYMMGLENKCESEFCESEEKTNSKEQAQKNEYNSSIKKSLDEWYEDNLEKYKLYIADESFCNDRSTIHSGYGNSNSLFGSYLRIFDDSYNDFDPKYKPIYTCPQKSDEFSVDKKNGNGKLTYPIGLITTNELEYAGLRYVQPCENNFLGVKNEYWTMSPSGVSKSGVYVQYVSEDNSLDNGAVPSLYGVYPVISLKSNTKVSGNGTFDKPYIVK